VFSPDDKISGQVVVKKTTAKNAKENSQQPKTRKKTGISADYSAKKLTKCSGKVGQTPGRTPTNPWKDGSDPWKN